jgi:ribonuclease Y
LNLSLIIFCGLLLGVLSFFFGVYYRKKAAESVIISAENEATRIVNDAVKLAETKKKDAILEGKDEILKQRSEFDKELAERRKEILRQEKRIQQKEETLDKKLEQVETKNESIAHKHKIAQEKLNEAESIQKRETVLLEKISGFSKDQAKEFLLEKLDNELNLEKAIKIKTFEEELKDESDKKAREIVSLAIQRCAADHVAETTIAVVNLPNDEMKGRIIGREGRNVRAIESLTGVDLIIDDTPEAITISTFDPIRREIAKLAIEKLIQDGRIHPSKIEEMIEKAKREINALIKAEGERAVLETRLNSMHPDLIKLLGQLKFRTSFGQNVLNHSLEVAFICGMICSELGLEPVIAKRAGLLHDIGKAADHEMEGSHVEIGVNIAKKYKENSAVIHAIQAHHGDVEPKTVVACIVQAADAISAARPGARRENIENYIKRLEKLEELALSFDGVERCFAIQAGREIRIIVKPEIIKDEAMIPLARNICKKVEGDLDYPGQIKVNLIRESRTIDYAK